MDGVILCDKPAGITSHDVVNILRRALHTKKVGHAGTLDPDATGVLVLCVNKATKALQFLTADTKEYIATLSLGQSTDTYDASGKVIEEKTFEGYQDIEKVLASFIGKQMQKPPMYSAIKIKGKKLYEYAREGKEVDVPEREIEIFNIELLNAYENKIEFKVSCSKGTYIRSLCVDIAKKLGYPGHMASLRRTKSGQFSIDDCISIEDIQQGNIKVIPLDDVFTSFDKVIVDDEKKIISGQKIDSDINHQVVVYSKEGKLLAIYGPDGQGHLKSIRGLF